MDHETEPSLLPLAVCLMDGFVSVSKGVQRRVACTVLSHCPISFHPGRQQGAPSPAQPWAPRALNLLEPPCPLLLPPSLTSSHHIPHKSPVLLVGALPKMLSFYLCFQTTVMASSIRLLLYSSPQDPY